MSSNWIILSNVAVILILFGVFIIIMDRRDKEEFSDYSDEDSKSYTKSDPGYDGN